MNILICGVPGSGKTTFGNWLQANHGFAHYDFEDGLPDKIVADNAVVTWGFVPDCETSKNIILKLIKAGFKTVWFSDRPYFHKYSYSRYVNRNKEQKPYVRNWLYFNQIFKIQENRSWLMFKKTVNPFLMNGKFKNPETLLKEFI